MWIFIRPRPTLSSPFTVHCSLLTVHRPPFTVDFFERGGESRSPPPPPPFTYSSSGVSFSASGASAPSAGHSVGAPVSSPPSSSATGFCSYGNDLTPFPVQISLQRVVPIPVSSNPSDRSDRSDTSDKSQIITWTPAAWGSRSAGRRIGSGVLPPPASCSGPSRRNLL